MPIFKQNAFRRAQLAAELTQKEAAEQIGVNSIITIQWEKGSDFPQRNNLVKAAAYPYSSTTESEFVEAVQAANFEVLLDVLDEHMDAIRALYPKEYAAVLRKIHS